MDICSLLRCRYRDRGPLSRDRRHPCTNHSSCLEELESKEYNSSGSGPWDCQYLSFNLGQDAHGWTKSVWRKWNLQAKVPLQEGLGKLLDGLWTAEIKLAIGLQSKKGQLCRGLEAVENWQCCSESQVTEDGPVGLNRRHRLTLSQSLCRSKTVLRSRYHLCRCWD